MTSKPRSHRRDFLRLAAASAIVFPAAAGSALYQSARGLPFPLDLPGESGPVPAPGTPPATTASPILLITGGSAPNPFGAFLAEILRAEGLNCFDSVPLSALTRDVLDQCDTALLAEVPVDAGQAELLEGFVFGGGRLVCMRPHSRLAWMLGVEPLPDRVAEGYLLATDHPVASGISGEPLQFHGTADGYRLAGARAVAWLSTSIGERTDRPAVTLHTFGQGQAAMWAFDLARSVAYTRQGNPAWANQERDGLDGLRAVDLLDGWVDLDRVTIPQADEQQRLLANLLSFLGSGARPVPRVWYFPGKAKGLLVATGDSHMNPAPCIDELLALVESRGGRLSIYYTPQAGSGWMRAVRRTWFLARDYLPVVAKVRGRTPGAPTPAVVARWRGRGHEFTVHPFVEEGLVQGWRRYWREFTGRGYGPVTSTVRTHRALWSGWVETARVQAACGVGMSLDAYQVGPCLRNRAGVWVSGHLTGSGLPMKYVDEQGRVLDIYQQNTQLTDEHLLAMDVPGWGGWSGLTPDEALDVSRAVLRRSVAPGGYSAIAIQCHVDAFQLGGDPASKARRWLGGTLDAAVDLGLPIWSAQEWLRFTTVRHAARFEDVRWHPSTRRLTLRLIVAAKGTADLTVLIPLRHAAHRVAGLRVDDAAVPFEELQVGGVTYASTTVSARVHELSAIYQ